MTKKSKQIFYEEQIPGLLAQMTRIAEALERQVELMDQRQELARQGLEKDKTDLEGQRAQRRQKFEAQLQKLAEVDRMARELRSKLEEKQAAEMAAKAAAEAAGEIPAEKKAAAAGGKGKAAKKPTPPTEN
jgi:hypothetical protein